MRQNLLRICISFLFLGVFLYFMRNDLPEIFQTLKSARISYVILGILIFNFGVLFITKRLQLMFGVQGIPLKYYQALSITYIGFFFNNFLPTAVGGDIVKAYCGARITGQRLKSFTCVLMDRIFGLLIFVFIPSMTIFFLWRKLDPAIPITIFSVFVVACIVALLIFNRRIASKLGFIIGLFNRFHLGEKLVTFYEGMHSFKNHKKMVASTLLLSLFAQVIMISGLICFIKALNANIPVIYVFLLTPVVHLMAMVPSINGLGVRETAFVYFFTLDSLGGSLAPSDASALAILYLFLLFIQSIIGAIVYLIRQDLHFRVKEIPSS